ncbi:MAG: GntR family transcriptional regulator [Planctomycetota bacterium]|nr:GntR family transcriptional regulator [Planctomycetota bacterium]
MSLMSIGNTNIPISMKIEPIAPRETAAEACEKALRAAILRGEIPAGERLPPERHLSERFGVTRITIRGALARLSASGLLQTRQGSGHIVRDFRQHGGPDLLSGLASLSDDPDQLFKMSKDLLKVRRHLAVAVLESFAELPQAPSTEAVADAVDAFAELMTDPRNASLEFAEADIQIFAALLEATGSLVLRLCLNPIVTTLRNLPALREVIYSDPARNLEGWTAFLQWLRDPQKDMIPFFTQFLAHNDEQSLERLKGQL